MMRVYVEGIGLCGPGLDGWVASVPMLAGTHDYHVAPTRLPPPGLLPANERRRAVQTVKIALGLGLEAFAAARRDPAATPTVFASSGGDGDTIDQILTVLASAQREISPTRFHNSVHNAPAGYWSIATGSRAASTSLCCFDDSFAAGLLEAAAQVVSEDCAVGLIAYDLCYPDPLSAVRPIGAMFGVALVLTPERSSAAKASVGIALGPRARASTMASEALESLRRNTPAARSLPLLAALSGREARAVTLDYLDDMAITLDVAPVADGA